MPADAARDLHALLFDTYGTVVDWRGGVLAALRALGRARGIAPDWEAFLVEWNTRAVTDQVNRGELPWMTMEEIHRHALETPLAHHGITMTEREIDDLVRVRWHLAPWPDSVAGLTRLKQRYVISPLSNASFM